MKKGSINAKAMDALMCRLVLMNLIEYVIAYNQKNLGCFRGHI